MLLLEAPAGNDSSEISPIRVAPVKLAMGEIKISVWLWQAVVFPIFFTFMVTVIVCPKFREEGETVQDVKVRSGWAKTRAVKIKEELKTSMIKNLNFFMVCRLK
jgi:hypothetical protein